MYAASTLLCLGFSTAADCIYSRAVLLRKLSFLALNGHHRWHTLIYYNTYLPILNNRERLTALITYVER